MFVGIQAGVLASGARTRIADQVVKMSAELIGFDDQIFVIDKIEDGLDCSETFEAHQDLPQKIEGDSIP